MNAAGDWLNYAKTPQAAWVAGSALLYAVMTNVFWLLRRKIQVRPAYQNVLVEAARFFFFLGIPYLALGGWPRPPFSGLLSLDDLGLTGFGLPWPATRWLRAWGDGLGAGLGVFLLLLLAWASANRGAGTARLRFAPRPWWALLVDGVYLQVHWAFYRGALGVTTGDVYAGTFLGLGLIYIEWAIDPAWRQGWRQADRAAERWLRAALALVAALLFLLTRNLWVCLAVHWGLELAFWRLGRAPSQRL